MRQRWRILGALSLVAVFAIHAVVDGGSAGATGERRGAISRVEHPPSDTVFVPAGPFTMGYPSTEEENANALEQCLAELGKLHEDYCPESNDQPFYLFANATPAREVFLHAFEIDRYEVSVNDYRRCVDAGACDVAALLAGDARYLEDGWPMGNVTWQDATDYCQWVGKRLPTEAEWEKAARGSDGRRWPWGNQLRSDGANHGKVENSALTHTHSFVLWNRVRRVQREFSPDGEDGGEYAVPPGTLIWGESPYGAYDMAGNVSEWVYDYYWGGDLLRADAENGGYSDLALISPVRRTPRDRVFDRVVRGGSWLTPMIFTRVYGRGAASPNSRSPLRGFRCARDPA